MLTWLRRYIAWLFVASAAVGAACAYWGWQRSGHIGEVLRTGVEATAVIEGAASVLRKEVFSFTVALAWKDAAGNVRRAAAVPVSQPFAQRIITDGVLVIPSTKIRYLADKPDRPPLIAEDADRQRAAAGRLMTYGLIGFVLGLLGACLFARRWAWPRREGAAT